MRNLEEAKELMRRLEAEKRLLVKALDNIDQEIRELQREVGAMVLCDTYQEPPKTPSVPYELPKKGENEEDLVAVRFGDYGKTYDYIWTGIEYPEPGDTVLVDTQYGEREATVTAVYRKKLNPQLNYKIARPL